MDSRETQQALERLCNAWGAAELDDVAMAPITEALRRHAEIAADSRQLAGAEEAVLGPIAERVATGEVTLAEGVAELHAAEATFERRPGGVIRADSRGTRLVQAAQVATVRLAAERLNDRAAELVATVEAEHDLLMTEVEKLAGVLEDIPTAALELTAGMTDAERAAAYDWDLLQAAVDAAGKKQADAFAKLGELNRRSGALIRAGDALEAVGISRPSGLANTSVYELAGVLPLRVAVVA